jgi:hypothetical protein
MIGENNSDPTKFCSVRQPCFKPKRDCFPTGFGIHALAFAPHRPQKPPQYRIPLEWPPKTPVANLPSYNRNAYNPSGPEPALQPRSKTAQSAPRSDRLASKSSPVHRLLMGIQPPSEMIWRMDLWTRFGWHCRIGWQTSKSKRCPTPKDRKIEIGGPTCERFFFP